MNKNKNISQLAVKSPDNETIYIQVDVGIAMFDHEADGTSLSLERFNKLIDDAIGLLQVAKVLKKDIIKRRKEDGDG